MLRRQGVGQKRHLPKGLEPRSVTSSLALMALGPWTNHPGTLDKSLPLAGHHFPISKQGNGTGFSGAFIGWPRMP